MNTKEQNRKLFPQTAKLLQQLKKAGFTFKVIYVKENGIEKGKKSD